MLNTFSVAASCLPCKAAWPKMVVKRKLHISCFWAQGGVTSSGIRTWHDSSLWLCSHQKTVLQGLS